MQRWQQQAIFYKAMFLASVSTLALVRALWTILSSRSRGTDTTTRRFASGMMVILFSLELAECGVWLVGTLLAGTANGAAPWVPQDPDKVDRWCYPLGLANYWLYMCMILWQLVLAYNIWAWVVKRESVSVLNRRIVPYLMAVLALSSVLSVAPVLEQNLGLWTNNTCYLHRTWDSRGDPTMSLIISRMIVLPIASVFILVLNASTVYRLRQEALSATQSGLNTTHSSNRLQIRLVLVAVTFVTINMLQCVPFYVKSQNFIVDLCTRWLFAVGLVDVLVFTYDWPSASNHTRQTHGQWCAYLLPCFREWRQKRDRHGGERAVSTSIWETMVPRPLRFASLAPVTTTITTTNHLSSPPSRTSSVTTTTTTAAAAAGVGGGSGSGSSLCRRHVLCTTFDMHHAQLQPHDLTGGVSSWIPREGYHVYCILVQRCRGLTKLRQAIQQHLGGVAKYQLCACVEVKGGHHLSSQHDRMALLVFARTVDVESGAFKVVGSNDQALSGAAAGRGCKGLVCVSFRYYDMSMAVLGIDLPSQADVDTAAARDKLVASMLHSLRLPADHDLYDTHLQWHHVVLMGSFKYGMQHPSPPPPSSPLPINDVLHDIAHASQKHQIARYDRIHSVDSASPEANTEHKDAGEISGEGEGHTLPQRQKGIADWVRDTDVLHHRMAHGQALHGFREQVIRFLPSYKWRHGASVDDRCDVNKLSAAFMTERVTTQTRIPPSYTDRVLVRSLPAVAGRLVLGPYELCEEGSLAGSSDHRPVSQALTLLVDTTKPLSCIWADSPHAAIDNEGAVHAAITAQAMARAAARRRQQQQQHLVRLSHRRAPPACCPGPDPPAASYPLYPTMRPPLSSSSGSNQDTQQFTAILVTLSLRSFSFQLCGFKWLEASPRRLSFHRKAYKEQPATPQKGPRLDYQESSTGGVVTSGLPQDFSYEAASSEGSEMPSGVPDGGYIVEMKSASEDAAALAYEKRDALRTPGFIEEVVITYPLSCEDPLLLLRRSQAFEHGLLHHHHHKPTTLPSSDPRLTRSYSTPDPHTPPPLHRPRSHTTTTHHLSSVLSASTRASASSSVSHTHTHVHQHHTHTHTPQREYPLQNTYRVPWKQCVAGDRGMGAGMGGSDDMALQLDILTLGAPAPIPTHALIKLIGRGGRQLGQGVICVSGCMGGGTNSATHPQSFMWRMFSSGFQSTASGVSSAHTHTHAPPYAYGGGGGGCGRHVVDLSVGGDLRGSVSMDVSIKARMKVAVQVPTSPLTTHPSPSSSQHTTPPRTHPPTHHHHHHHQPAPHQSPPAPAAAAAFRQG